MLNPLMTVDIADYYKQGDAVSLDVEHDGGYVLVEIECDGGSKDVTLTPPQARALAAALVHCAKEVTDA